MYLREDMAEIHISVADESGNFVPYFDSWATAEGANLSSDSSKTRAGGMGSEVSLGGPSSRDDVTCTIQQSDVVLAKHKELELRVRQDAPTKVAWRYLDRLKNPVGDTHTVTGTLKSAFRANADVKSSDAAFYTIIVDCDEVAA